MDYEDLREWILHIEEMGELKRLEDADVDDDIGPITDITEHHLNGPTVLFDNIKGFSPGYRVLVNPLSSLNRAAFTGRLPVGLPTKDYVDLWYKRFSHLSPIEPQSVPDGPVMQNAHQGADVNLLEFPVPLWHDRDGGRYIGTADVVITRDPDEGWVNLGTYRVMLIDKNHVSFYISPGKHGRIHREKYFAKGVPCPVAISLGHDPLLFLMSSSPMPPGVSEYEFAGGIKGKPIEVIRGPITGLPIPARAEIVIEGEASATTLHPEGPFGEWNGYYASGSRQEPVLEVKAVYHRRDPILMCTPPAKPPTGKHIVRACIRSARIKQELQDAGVPDVTGVWLPDFGGTRLFVVVSIKQRYPGHARQAAHVAAFCRSGAYMGRYIVVVDDDIDVFDTNDVMWAVCTRSDPERSLDIIRRCWSGPVDSAIRPGEKGFSSRAIIDACRPFEWKDEFPPVVELTKDVRERALEKWGDKLFS
ncbi:MAG: UbiD family decarboxylase [Chloroflexi bacterium]|nr:UbiD family decarboxylase [Chloroflexota bacterium]